MLEGSPIGNAKTQGLLSRISATKGRFSYMLLAIAGAAVFFLAAGTNVAFADSALQYAPDAFAASQGGQTYARQVADSVSVVSNFDNPSSRFAARTFVRGMSDGVGVASEFGGPSGQAAGSPARTLGPQQPAGQRVDFSQRLLLGNNRVDGPLYGAGAVAQSGTPTAEVVAVETDEMDFSELATLGNGDDPDGSSSQLLRQITAAKAYLSMEESMRNAALMNTSTSAVLLTGALIVVVTRQPVVSGNRVQKRMLTLFMIKRTNGAAQIKGTNSVMVILAVFAVSSIAIAATPSSAQEHGDGANKSRIEITSAYHLDSDGRFFGDIYGESSELDGVWSEEIADGHRVRVTFEHGLTSARDITIYPRVISGTPKIQVYEIGENEPVAEFTSINSAKYNKVFLKGLQGSQDTFDLRVTGGSVEFDHIVDPAPVPTYVGAGTVASGAGAITPALPTGIQADDILLLFLETDNEAITIPTPNGGTWTPVTDSPQGTGTAGGLGEGTATRLTVFWSRFNGSQGAPTTSDSGNHQLGVILAFRGVATTGDPWDVTSGSIDATSDTSLSGTGDTTTVENTLVVMAAALHTDGADFGTWTNTDLASITSRLNAPTTAGNDGRLGIATGEKATAGAYGATTNMLTGSSVKGMMAIALRPPPPGPPTLSISQPDGTSDTASAGESYNITYTLSDPEDTVTAAFYYDTNNSGLDGTAIAGACATAAEGTAVTCAWDTTGVTPGSYYVYGISNDGTNPAVSAYSSGQITVDKLPFFVGAGTSASGAGAITPALPTGIQADDILLLFLETANQAITIPTPNGGTWTPVTDSPQGTGTAGGATATALAVFWSRFNGSQGAPTTSDSGDHQLGVILAFRGVATTGDPWDVTSGSIDATSDTSLSGTGDTTTTANTLVVVAAALMDDAQDFGSNWTNTDFASITSRLNAPTTAGNDGRIGVVTGKKATAGLYGDTTNTLTGSSVKGMMTIALKPAPLSRSISDTLSIADSLSAKIIRRAISDSLPVADSISRTAVLAKPIADALTLADSVAATKAGFRSISDSVTVSAAVAGVPTPNINMSDAIAVTDQVARTYAGSRSISDTFAATDNVERGIGKAIADTVTVAVSVSRSETNLAAIAYRSDDGTNTSMSPKYREWNVTTRTWGDQVELESSGSPIRNAWLEFSPVSSKRVIVVLSSDGMLDSYVCDNGCTDPAKWTVTHDIVDLWTDEPAATWRPFDIEYENTSGDLLMVYDRTDGGNPDTDLFYRVMPDSSHTFGSEGVLNDTGPSVPDNIYSFVRMDARRTTGSNDIGLAALAETNNRSIAWYWNGTTDTFGSENELTNALFVHDYEAMGIGFETFTGHLIAVSGEGTNVIYSEFDGTTWTTETSVGAIDVGTVRWIRYVANANAGSSSGFLAVSGYTGTQHQLDSAHWSGTTWSVYDLSTRHDSNIDDSATRTFDFAWDNSDDALRGVLVYGTTSGSMTFKRYAEPNTWTAGLSFSDDGTHPWVALNENSNPTAADITSVLGAGIDSDGDIGGLNWDGAPPVVNPTSTGDDGITTSGSTASESFRIDYKRSSLIKKFPPVVLTITDQITVKIPSINVSDSIAAADSILAEKGTLGSSSAAAAVYKSSTGSALLNSPKYREWDPATQTWSAEVELANIGSPMRDGKIRFSPDSALRAIVTHSDDGTLNLFKCDNMCTSASSWTHANADFADTGTPSGYSTEPYRPYDTMFETTGERMIIVYDKELTEDADFYYRTYDGTTLSPESSVNLGGAGDAEVLRYFKLAAHPTTNEMVLTVMDATNNRSYALVWDDTTWTNQLALSSSLSADNKDGESIGVAYEASGAAVVVSGNGANSLAYARWSGSWSPVSTVDPDPASGNDVKFVSVRGDPAASSDRVMVCQSDDLSDLSCSQFSAGIPGSWTTITDDVGTVAGRAFDYVYHPAGTTGLLLSATASAGSLEYRAFNGSTFGSLYTVPATGTHRWVSGSPANSSNDYVNALFLESDSNFDTGALKYKANVVTLVGDSSLTANSQNEDHEGLHHEFQKSKRVKRIVTDTITFADAISRTTGKNIPDILNIIDLITRTINVARSTSETLAVTDALERIIIFVRSTSETLAVTDSMTRRYHGSRSANETVAVADNTVRTVHYQRSPDETLGVADALARAITFTVPLADSVGVTDSIARTYLASRLISDTATVADSAGRTLIATRSASDTIAIADGIAGSHLASKSASDTLGVTDQIARTISITVAIADSVATTDAVARIHSASRAVADAVSTADAIARMVALAKNISDALAVTDAITARVTGRSIAEAVTVSDGISAKITAKAISDSLAVVDAITARITARAISDTLSVTDLISAKVIARNVSDELAVSDAVTAKIGSRNVADSVAVADTLSARVSGRAMSDALAVADAIKAAVNRSVADALFVTDAITTSATRATADAISVADAIAAKAIASRTVSDALALGDTIAKSVTKNLADTVSVSDAAVAVLKPAIDVNESVSFADSIRTSVARSISDAVTVQDSARPTSTTVNIFDSVGITVGVRITSMTIHVADAVGFADSARPTSVAISIADSVAVADAARTASMTINIADALAVADQALPTSRSVNIPDSLAVTDQIKAVVPPHTAEQVAITDAIALHVNRLVSEAISVSDLIVTGSSTHYTRDISDSLAAAEAIVMTFGNAVNIDDSLAVNTLLTNVSVHWNRIFGEGFDIAAPVCLPNQCLHNVVFNESFQLGATFMPPPQMADTLAVTDRITRGIKGSAVPQPTDSVSFSDSVTAVIIGILVVDKKEYAGPLPSTPISGNFTYSGDPANLKAQVHPVPIPINSTVVRPNLPGDVTILRTYHVPIVPNAAIPGDDAIVTETQKEVPAMSNMFMRLNFEETPQLNEHEKFIKTLDIEFTPRVDSTDFGLVVAVIDGPPGIAPLPAEELRPIYVDVRWVGSFPGTESPAVQTYYQNPPTFTFTVNDEWVKEQEANRDSNGVPTLKLWLLDEGTNKWEQITSITKPVAGDNGTYTFVATLPHFSDYAITATKAPKAPGSGGNQQPQPPVPVVPPAVLAIDLLESIAFGDQQQSVPIEVIEEFGEEKYSVRIADAIAIFSKPVSYKTFQVGEVNVRITVQDVRQESVVPPKATATFLVELDNLGHKEEEFTLNFWYYDQSGKKPYESSQVASIGPHGSKQLLVDVPFTEPGVFEVTAEARSIPGDDLVNTVQLTVTIPWLAINLYVLVVVAVAILGASGGVMAVLLRGGLAGAGTGTALFLLTRKRKPTIRVTDRLAGIEDEYDIVVGVRQREAQGAQAMFDLEIVNKSKRTHEFMLKYWAADLSGIRMSEHVERVRIKGRTTVVKAAQVVLPPGQNIFVAEAGPVSEKQARWSHAGVRVRAG